MKYLWQIIVGFCSVTIFFYNGMAHLAMARNLKPRARATENLDEGRFKLTFCRRGEKHRLHFLQQDIEQIERCPDPKLKGTFLGYT